MPVTFEIHPERGLSIVTFAGLFTVEETETVLAAFRAQGGQKQSCIFEFLRPVTDFKLENIQRVCAQMMPQPGQERPTAFVGDTDLSYEVCDAIVRFIGQPGRVRVFRSRADAENWLNDRLAGRN